MKQGSFPFLKILKNMIPLSSHDSSCLRDPGRVCYINNNNKQKQNKQGTHKLLSEYKILFSIFLSSAYFRHHFQFSKVEQLWAKYGWSSLTWELHFPQAESCSEAWFKITFRSRKNIFRGMKFLNVFHQNTGKPM